MISWVRTPDAEPNLGCIQQNKNFHFYGCEKQKRILLYIAPVTESGIRVGLRNQILGVRLSSGAPVDSP
jgi:hypothetical protein